MAVYEIEARVRFATAAGVDSTLDFGMTWVAAEARQTTLAAVGAAPRTLLDVMKRVDSTYTVNTERNFQARNASGYEVELLLPMSLAGTLPRNETLFPFALPEQDWLRRTNVRVDASLRSVAQGEERMSRGRWPTENLVHQCMFHTITSEEPEAVVA
jgi:hypothetical protein